MYQVLLLHGQIEMSTFFEFPTLPDGSHLQRSGDSVSILCGKRNINWQSKSGDSTILTQLLQELKDGLFPVNSYYARYPKLNLTQLFDSLDTYGLLCEGPHPDTGARHGKCVITRLEQEYRRRGEACQSSILWPLLDSGQASAKLLSGLAAEYYFLTTGAYDALSPAICRLQGEHKMHAINFMLGEYRHDKFMLKSWQACGVTDATVARALPHPYTRAVSNLLGYWAECDQLSFMAALFIVEGLDDNEAQYIELLKKNTLPEAYLDGLLEHDRANHEEDHGQISRQLFASIPYISEAEEERISARLRQLHWLLLRRMDELVRYYNDQHSQPHRVFVDDKGPACSQLATERTTFLSRESVSAQK